jgi:hypothetical protein
MMTFLNQFHEEVTKRKMRKIAESQKSPMSSIDFANYMKRNVELAKKDVTPFEREQRMAEQMAKSGGYWIPMMQMFDIGVPGPCGNENSTYVTDDAVFKVNNLMNSGSIVALLHKILLHNFLFPDTAYQFHGFAGFDGRSVQPVFRQVRVANATPATQIMIDTYMAALGFVKTENEGRFSNGQYIVWDVVPRNVLVDAEGDIFVVDAEIKRI